MNKTIFVLLSMLLASPLAATNEAIAQSRQMAEVPTKAQRRAAERENLGPQLAQLLATRGELERALNRAINERAGKSAVDVLREQLARLDRRIAEVRKRLG
jgi:hypothetical protein